MKAIMYHYIRNSDKNFPYFRYLSVDNFKKQLDYFEQEFGFVNYDDFISLSKDFAYFHRLKDKILLTFDDGFLDHYKFVMDELIKRKTFGIFFIPTGIYVKRKALDVHRIHYLIGQNRSENLLQFANKLINDNMLEKDKIQSFKEKTYLKQDNDEATNEFKKLFNYYIKYEYRESILDKIVGEFTSDEKIFDNLYMDENQLKQMQENGMILGSHSVDHLVFSKLDENKQIYQIKHSFEFLENLLGKLDIKCFCYPYGGYHTFTDFTEKILHANGCNFSFNVESKDIDLNIIIKRSQALPRYDCNEFKFGQSSLG
ncbi:polysaccharide deacetylase family protein [Campylobacter lari]|uniref:polysaccharide deacetylase family protein n=1 Tax=Campylobacter lari TaxID=201 RepID=UPI00372B169B